MKSTLAISAFLFTFGFASAAVVSLALGRHAITIFFLSFPFLLHRSSQLTKTCNSPQETPLELWSVNVLSAHVTGLTSPASHRVTAVAMLQLETAAVVFSVSDGGDRCDVSVRSKWFDLE